MHINAFVNYSYNLPIVLFGFIKLVIDLYMFITIFYTQTNIDNYFNWMDDRHLWSWQLITNNNVL